MEYRSSMVQGLDSYATEPHMAQWGEAGYELVTAQAVQIIGTQWTTVFWWRRPVS